MNVYPVNAINSTTYRNCNNIDTIDLRSKSWTNNSMYFAFDNSTNITVINSISNSITNMQSAFTNCTNLVDAPVIPDSVICMVQAFYNCTNLVNVPSISNNTIDMTRTFAFCSSLVNIPAIPNSVTNMCQTFTSCRNLISAPEIPSTVTNLMGTFHGCVNMTSVPTTIPQGIANLRHTFRSCSKITTVPAIPNSVTDLGATFGDCWNITSAPDIPNSVIYMGQTFEFCYNLTGNINIYSNQIINATNCFNNTTQTKNVYIPFRNSDATLSATYNSFVAAGYDNAGTTNGVYLKTLTPMLTINATPSDATITFDNLDFIYKNTTSIMTNRSTQVTYTVSRANYTSVTDTILLEDDRAIDVNLAGNSYTVTIATTPADATVTFDTSTSGGTVSGKSITVPYNTQIKYSVSRTGYQTLSNQTYTVTQTETVNATALTKNNYTLTINPTPNDATVTLTATGYTQSGNAITVPYETQVSYTVARTGYATQTGTETVTSTKTTPITLTKNNYTLTVTTNPADATINFSTGTVSGHSVTVPYNTTITYTVSKSGYITSDTQTYTVTQTETITGPTLTPDTAILTVNPTPNDATIVLTATGFTQTGNIIIVTTGTTVHYVVSKTGYTTAEGDVIVDTTKTITPELDKIYYAWDYGTSTVYTDTATPTTSTTVLTSSLTPKSGYTISNVSGSTISVNHNQSTSVSYRCWYRNPTITVTDWGTLSRNPSTDGTRTVTSRTYGTYQQYTFGWGSYHGLDPVWYGQSVPLSQVFSGKTNKSITSYESERVYVKDSTPVVGSLVYNSSFAQTGSVSATGTINCGATTYVSGFNNGGQWTRQYITTNSNTYYRYSSGDTTGTETTVVTENYTRNSSKDITD